MNAEPSLQAVLAAQERVKEAQSYLLLAIVAAFPIGSRWEYVGGQPATTSPIVVEVTGVSDRPSVASYGEVRGFNVATSARRTWNPNQVGRRIS